MHKPQLNFLVFAFILGLFACQEYGGLIEPSCEKSWDAANWDSCNYTSYKFDKFEIKELQGRDLPYVNGADHAGDKSPYDSSGVPLHNYKGQLNYHPVYIAQYGLQLADVYSTTKDSAILSQLELVTAKMIEVSLKADSAIYFPYTFDFSLHGCAAETMVAPWYSGMAQGQMLSLFCWMYELTGKPVYLDNSRKIFNSFTRFKGNGVSPWLSCVDKNGNLWLEEYPRDQPCFTLNGMIFAIYGVYDFYRITHDEKVKELLLASITTIKTNIHKYRNENDISWYCQKHHIAAAKSKSYHGVHIQQLNMLYKITGDAYFKEMADKLSSDS